MKNGTLSPGEGLEVEYRELPYSHEVELLREKLLKKLKGKKRLAYFSKF